MCLTARAAWLAPTSRRCGTSMPWAGRSPPPRRWRRLPRLEVRKFLRAVDEGPGQLGKAAVAPAGAAPQDVEGIVHVQAEALGEFPLRLLDDDSAVQRGLQLLVERLAAAQSAFVEQADGGHVGESLADPYVRPAEWPGSGAEEVQRADGLVAQPHRQGLHGGESRLAGDGGEMRPAPRFHAEVGGRDGLAAAEAVQAGTLIVLELEKLHQPGLLAG